jgi:hypothetical protein
MFKILEFVCAEFKNTAELIQSAMTYIQTPPQPMAIKVAARRLPPPANTTRKF